MEVAFGLGTTTTESIAAPAGVATAIVPSTMATSRATARTGLRAITGSPKSRKEALRCLETIKESSANSADPAGTTDELAPAIGTTIFEFTTTGRAERAFKTADHGNTIGR
jgi:hypothetical protein